MAAKRLLTLATATRIPAAPNIVPTFPYHRLRTSALCCCAQSNNNNNNNTTVADGNVALLGAWRVVRAVAPRLLTNAAGNDGDDNPAGALINTFFIRLPVLAFAAAFAVNVLLGGGIRVADVDWPPQSPPAATGVDSLQRLRGGARTGSSLLWSKPQALATLKLPALVRLGTGTLGSDGLEQLAADRAVLVDGLRGCLAGACGSIAAATEGAADGKWVAGRWVTSPAKDVRETAARLAVMVEAERVEPASRDAAAASAAAMELRSHLLAAEGAFASLGAAAPVVRTMGWSHDALLRAGLDGGGSQPCADCIGGYAERWLPLAEACDATFDAACSALSQGVVHLSVGGALADVESAVALREAATSASLLYELLAEMVGDEGGEEEMAARAVLEALEGSGDDVVVFIRGVGWRAQEGQVEARRVAADSWRAASRSVADPREEL